MKPQHWREERVYTGTTAFGQTASFSPMKSALVADGLIFGWDSEDNNYAH
ncbi:hypothetical protein [Mangrovimicrobium sediminis]|nr:hypothetical protein [Haliea sp. SAOS-164]